MPTGDAQARPVSADGTVFAVSAGAVTAVDAGTGAPRWSTAVGTAGYGLWLDGSDVIVSVDQVGRDAEVVSLAADTGRVRWRWRPGGTGLLGDQLLTGDGGLAVVDSAGQTVVLDLAGGTVRWMAGGRVQVFGLGVVAGSVLRAVGGTLTAYNAATGGVRWRRQVVQPARLTAVGTAVLVTGAAIGPSIDGAATAYDARDGRLLWRIGGSIAYGFGGGTSDGVVLFTELGAKPGIVFVDAVTGQVRWRSDTQIGLFLPAIVSASAVTTEEGGTFGQPAVRLVQRDARTGRVLTDAALPVSPLASPVALTNGRVAVVEPGPPGHGSSLAVYEGGHQVWVSSFTSFARWVVAASDGTTYVQTVDPAYGCSTFLGRRGPTRPVSRRRVQLPSSGNGR